VGLVEGDEADEAALRELDEEGVLALRGEPRLGSKRVIQRRLNVSVPRARAPGKASTLRDRSER
jgi:hypothetical protein